MLVVLELLKLLTGVKIRTHENRMAVGVHGVMDQGVDDRSRNVNRQDVFRAQRDNLHVQINKLLCLLLIQFIG